MKKKRKVVNNAFSICFSFSSPPPPPPPPFFVVVVVVVVVISFLFLSGITILGIARHMDYFHILMHNPTPILILLVLEK